MSDSPPTQPPLYGPVPRFALTREEAAVSLGMSVRSFDRYVGPEVKVVRRGALRLYPLSSLQAWVDRAATLAGGQ